MLFLGVLCLAVGAMAHPTFYMPRTALEYPMAFPYYPRIAIMEAEKPVPGIPVAPKLEPLSLVKEVTVEEFKEGDWRLEEDKEEKLDKYDDGEWKGEELKEDDGQWKGEELKEDDGQWKGEELKEDDGQWKGEELKEEEVMEEVVEPKDKEDEEVIEPEEKDDEEVIEFKDKEDEEIIEPKEKEDEEEIEKHGEEEKTEDESEKPVVVELDGPKLPEFITNLWANRPTLPHITLPTINFPFSLPSFFPKTRPLVPTADIPYIVGTSQVRILDKN